MTTDHIGQLINALSDMLSWSVLVDRAQLSPEQKAKLTSEQNSAHAVLADARKNQQVDWQAEAERIKEELQKHDGWLARSFDAARLSTDELPEWAGGTGKVLRELEELKRQNAAMRDAGEMLWTVVANVSGGDWNKQTKTWRQAAERWRDYYFKVITAYPPPIGRGS